jgi:hypothetical protein
MGLLAGFHEGRRRFVAFESLDNGYPSVHHKIAPLRGVCKASGGVLNLRVVMIRFRNGFAEMFDRISKRD